MFGSDIAILLPEIVLAVFAMLGLLAAVYTSGDGKAPLLVWLSAGLLALIGLYIAFTGVGVEQAFGGMVVNDGFARFAKVVILLAAAAILLVGKDFLKRDGLLRFEYPMLIVLATVGMMVMVSAGDLMTLYMGLELQSLSLYVVASMRRDSVRSTEAGLKYFVLGALSSGLLLYGASLTYGFAGTTSFAGIIEAAEGGASLGLIFGLVFMFAGLAFKVSAVPFHMWTPDVYEGAPTPVTAFFATAPKVAAVALTARVVFEVFGAQVAAWQQIVMFMALASIIFGALGAIGQENLKRLLAYSSINNVGFILLGLAVANVDGASAMLVYLFIYVAMSLGSFVALLMLRGEDGCLFETFADIRGLSVTQPAIAWALLLFMFSLAGVPPLLGFYSKFVVFQATIEADLVVFGAIAIAASVIGAFYYIKFVKVMFFDEPAGVITGKSGAAHWALLGITALIVSPLGYLLTPSLTDLADKAAASLFLTV